MTVQKKKRRLGRLILAVFVLLAAGACVTVARTHEIEISVVVPCEGWDTTDQDGAFTVEVFRAGTGLDTSAQLGVWCAPEIEASIACDASTTKVLKFGYLPEVIGVRVTSESGATGYAVDTVLEAGQTTIAVGPELNDWAQLKFCRDVSVCLFGDEEALRYCSGLDQPFDEVTPTPEPSSPTPTPEPSSPTPTPAPSSLTPTPEPSSLTPTPEPSSPTPTPEATPSTTPAP